MHQSEQVSASKIRHSPKRLYGLYVLAIFAVVMLLVAALTISFNPRHPNVEVVSYTKGNSKSFYSPLAQNNKDGVLNLSLIVNDVKTTDPDIEITHTCHYQFSVWKTDFYRISVTDSKGTHLKAWLQFVGGKAVFYDAYDHQIVLEEI